MTTASIIIIGDEILSNKFQDENTPYLLTKCAEFNLKVLSVQIIPDTLDRIASAVQEESARSRYVFTTGGVGPTHDDMTFKGVAQAFNESLYRHPELVQLIDQYSFANEATYRMAEVPSSTELLPTNRGFPQIQVHNVFIFPGVPSLLRSKFEAIEHLLVGSIIHRTKIALNVRETDIALLLEDIQKQNPLVSIGSYPRFHETPSLILTLESDEVDDLLAVAKLLENAFKGYLHQDEI